MLNHVVNVTERYMERIPKSDRKKIGQFFTSKNTAVFMAEMFKENGSRNLDILDPGAGTGILSAALIERLQSSDLDSIHLVAYENDERIIHTLKSNCSYLIESSEIPLTVEVVKKNFILDNDFDASESRFDLIISNPPYRKIAKDAPESQGMLDVVYGSPNLYFLFMGMSISLLRENGEMVFIVPRSWTSGTYFRRFRKYLVNNVLIDSVHLFGSRNNLFGQDRVLQETMIVKVSKGRGDPGFVNVSSSSDFSFHDLKEFKVACELAHSFDDNSYVFTPASQREADVLETINRFEHSLPDLGIRLKTGLTVGFKNDELLSHSQCPRSVPIFYPCHFDEGMVRFPAGTEKKQFILNDKESLLHDNKNFLFLKRFTSKEEKRRLQPAIYLQDSLKEFDYISTDNKVNFIDTVSKDDVLTLSELYGLFALFNSTLYDSYYRILDGSTQVNAREINSMPVPDRDSLKGLGNRIIHSRNMTTAYCDKILGELIYG